MTLEHKDYVVEDYVVVNKPYYHVVADEVNLFTAAYENKIPVLLKGPTGCGKTRFIEYMAWFIKRPLVKISNKKNKGTSKNNTPLITIACHEDLSAGDLVGRYLLEDEKTRWIDGPLTRAVKTGGICYLDEIVEARKDTTVLIHPLTDHRRILPIEKLGRIIEADDRFLLVISYNPGYQSAVKDLKQSTRQRFISIEFDYPPADIEKVIIEKESLCGSEHAEHLSKLGEKVRNTTEHGLSDGVSTRLLIYAGKLIKSGISPRRACEVAVVWGISDDQEIQQSLREVVESIFAK